MHVFKPRGEELRRKRRKIYGSTHLLTSPKPMPLVCRLSICALVASMPHSRHLREYKCRAVVPVQ